MLNKDALSQLQDLKTQLAAETERADAVVRGARSRYGFAVLPDGREIFIPEEEMLKVLPDDRVRISIHAGKDGRQVAEIEKLLHCPTGEFCGRCVRKGRALFVEPDLPRQGRWLFIPPRAGKGAAEGDYVRAALRRHPFQDGKPQAEILEVFGNADTPGVENRYTAARHHLPSDWSPEAEAELGLHSSQDNPPQDKASKGKAPEEKVARKKTPGKKTDNARTENAESNGNNRVASDSAKTTRLDLCHLAFVSIDSSRTRDIDDALFAETSPTGWTLYVAIADPTEVIKAGSALEREMAARGSSVYFHGNTIPMMPEALSQNVCSLVEGRKRAALVCIISVSDAGEVGEFEFVEATVRSRARLSYSAVDRYLAGNSKALMSHASPLEALYQAYRALRARRETRELVMENRPDYRCHLDENGKIANIESGEKLLSQRLVEECMIATNRCAARFLRDGNRGGPFVVHGGFRGDRAEETRRFLKRFLPDLLGRDLGDVDTYREIIQRLSTGDHELPLRAMVNRLLMRTNLGIRPGPHMGMALECYTQCTSPLRRYLDFLVHRQIKAALRGSEPTPPSKSQLARLSEAVARNRRAVLEAESWLHCQFLAQHAGEEHAGRVSALDSHGCRVRLLKWNIEGHLDLGEEAEKFRHDRWTATLSSPTRCFQLEQELPVRVQAVNVEKREIVLLPLGDLPMA